MSKFDAVLARYRVSENPARALRRLELVALGLGSLLLLWAVFGGLSTAIGGGPKPLLPAEDTLKVRALGLERPLDEEGSDRLVNRPLFWEGRRAIDKRPVGLVVTTPKPAQVKKIEGVTLHGVYGEGESLGVIATVDGKMTRVGAGNSVKGWTLAAYRDGEVVFENGGRTQTLPLELTAPSVTVLTAPKPTSDDTGGESAEGVAAQAREEQQAKLKELGGGLTFGGNSSSRGRKK
jgi:hypothetical protein